MYRSLAALLFVSAACAPAGAPASAPASASVGRTAAPAMSGSPTTESEREVIAVLVQMFDAMRAGDSATLGALFHPDARLMSVSGEGASARVGSIPVEEFVAAVGSPHEEVWDERIWDVRVEVDGPLAAAWMQYAFHLDDRLSHCGVNAVQLARSATGWKVIHVADTRRRSACVVPPGAT